MVRGGDTIEFGLGMTKAAWQFAVLGYSDPKKPDWTKRRRIFRTLRQIPGTDQRHAEQSAAEQPAKDVDAPVPQNGHGGPATATALGPTKEKEAVGATGFSKN